MHLCYEHKKACFYHECGQILKEAAENRYVISSIDVFKSHLDAVLGSML